MYRLTARLDALEDVVSACGSAVVASSGGLGSALVAHVAHRTLGEAALIVDVASERIEKVDVDRLLSVASARGIRTVFDGADTDEDREPYPGIRSPLVEAGFTGADVRAAARFLGLPALRARAWLRT